MAAVTDNIHNARLFPFLGRFPVTLFILGSSDDLHKVLGGHVDQIAGKCLFPGIACNCPDRAVLYLGGIDIHLGRGGTRRGDTLFVEPADFKTAEFYLGHPEN